MTKRTRHNNDENDPFAAVYTPDQPPSKRHRRSGLPNTNDPSFQEEWARAVEARQQAEKDERARKEAEALEEAAAKLCTRLRTLRSDGYSLTAFLSDLFNSKGPHISSEVTKLIQDHSASLFDAMRLCCPEVAQSWLNETIEAAIVTEAKHLAAELRPDRDQELLDVLHDWKLDDVLAAAERIAPTLLQVLRLAGTHKQQGETRCNHDLIIATILCLIAESYSEHSNEVQTVMGIYLFACGASRSQFAVLHHASITSSYTKFCVGEQCHNHKDHFDSGTTATLVPLHGIDHGELPLSVLKPRTTCIHALNFEPVDLLPSAEQIQQLEDAML
ncbi:uncharacterized protein PHACADRAFT_165800 [Phanerochaete carnosa HHB-10118-sp]|uniref:Uncharacterized protein n=1 Tax=Phanerochaete carnosa (strain HHB-10118-sp) TaxID=650164 RepID=K5VWL8_PHACS|nr:uncharacterized protein PHACADRAFT_165800 [Phanerochaete carnosa HHB-10118-sp]EKM51205.1 hypothetical protein PHACADRAFT_165800 [Phanerochaete carnosa HHB-10118-sp]